MRLTKWTVLLAVLVIASLVLSACGGAAPTPVKETVVVEVTKEVTKEVTVEKTVVVVATPEPAPAGPKTVRINFGAGDVPTIDPAISTDTSSVQVVDATTVGLTRQNEVTSLLKPGMATKWDISPDGKSYTFSLRNDVPWVKYDGGKNAVVKVQDCNGADRMVNAYDFQYGILRTLAPATASDYAYVLNFVLAGGADYNSGTVTDTAKVGVTVVDTYTLKLDFNEAAAYNGAIAGMWIAHAQPKWVIEGDDCTDARGDRWTEPGFFQSYGPFTLKSWIHDSTMTIVKNPFWPGTDETPQAKLDEVTFTMLDENAAFAEYEAGNLDAVAVPSTELDRVKADPDLSKQLVVAPNTCTYYYGFNTQAPFVDDVRVRRALSASIDRQGLIDNVLKGGQRPAQWFAYPGIAGAPTMDDHPDLGIKFDVAAANKDLDAYLAEKGLTKDKVDITLMFNTSSGHQKIAEAIQQMWKTNLGIDVKLANQEWKVFLKTIRDPKGTPQIYRLGWCMDYADANNFDREVFAKGGSANPSEGGGINWKNDKFEELVKQAAVELDAAKRVDLYAQAEQILVYDDAAMAPIYWYTRNTATKPYVQRTFSVSGHEALEKWDITK